MEYELMERKPGRERRRGRRRRRKKKEAKGN
jgi:hypothetical protein